MGTRGTPVPAGSQLGRFKLLSFLGRGSFGDVYLAQDRGSGRRVGLKVLSRSPTPEAHAAMDREVRALHRLHHPLVPGIRASGEEAGRIFLALAFVEGETLRRRLRRKGRLEPAEALVLGESLCRALAHCHERGVLHLDLKPANLVVDDQGAPHLLDFGLAEFTDEPARSERAGTPRYMAPEQWKGAPRGPSTDLYQVGLILAECLLGRPAFSRRSSSEDAMRDRAFPVELSPEYPGEVRQLVTFLTEPDPQQRPGDAREVAEVLEGLLPSRSRRRPETPAGGFRRPSSGPIVSPVSAETPLPALVARQRPGLVAPALAAWGLGLLVGAGGTLLGVGFVSQLLILAGLVGLAAGRTRRPPGWMALAAFWGVTEVLLAVRLMAEASRVLTVLVILGPLLMPFVALVVGGLWIAEGVSARTLAEPEVAVPTLLEAVAPGLGHAEQGEVEVVRDALLPMAVVCLALVPFGVGVMFGSVLYWLSLAMVALRGAERHRDRLREEARLLLEVEEGCAEKIRCQAGMAILTSRLVAAAHRGRWQTPASSRAGARLAGGVVKGLVAQVAEARPCFEAHRLRLLPSGGRIHLYCDRHNLCPAPLPPACDREAPTGALGSSLASSLASSSAGASSTMSGGELTA